MDLEIRRFDAADELRTFEHGTFELVKVGGMTVGHDSWVVGDEPYVSLHFLGAEDYAEK